MQAVEAIESSNEHIAEAKKIIDVRVIDWGEKAFIEAQLANAKALQALAFAILATIESE